MVDLYGDVLCVTDHAYRGDDPWLAAGVARRGIDTGRFAAYLAEIEREVERAWERYALLVLPGIELSYNDLDPTRSAHVVVIDLREFISLDEGIVAAVDRASAHGVAFIGAHPYDRADGTHRARLTLRFAVGSGDLTPQMHRLELFNRSQLFPWVARAGHPGVATGDFHRLEHLDGWKTLIPCERQVEAVVSYLRSSRPVYLARFDISIMRVAA